MTGEARRYVHTYVCAMYVHAHVCAYLPAPACPRAPVLSIFRHRSEKKLQTARVISLSRLSRA